MRIHSYFWAEDQILLQIFDRWIWRSWLLKGIESGQFLGNKQEISYMQHQQNKKYKLGRVDSEKCTSFAKIKVKTNDKTQDE